MIATSGVCGGVLPTPAVALLPLDLGPVISASPNPPQYNGVKLFDGEGRKLTDAAEEEIEALLDAEPAEQAGEIDRVAVATDSYFEHIVDLDRVAGVGPNILQSLDKISVGHRKCIGRWLFDNRNRRKLHFGVRNGFASHELIEHLRRDVTYLFSRNHQARKSWRRGLAEQIVVVG